MFSSRDELKTNGCDALDVPGSKERKIVQIKPEAEVQPEDNELQKVFQKVKSRSDVIGGPPKRISARYDTDGEPECVRAPQVSNIPSMSKEEISPNSEKDAFEQEELNWEYRIPSLETQTSASQQHDAQLSKPGENVTRTVSTERGQEQPNRPSNVNREISSLAGNGLEEASFEKRRQTTTLSASRDELTNSSDGVVQTSNVPQGFKTVLSFGGSYPERGSQDHMLKTVPEDKDRSMTFLNSSSRQVIEEETQPKQFYFGHDDLQSEEPKPEHNNDIATVQHTPTGTQVRVISYSEAYPKVTVNSDDTIASVEGSVRGIRGGVRSRCGELSLDADGKPFRRQLLNDLDEIDESESQEMTQVVVTKTQVTTTGDTQFDSLSSSLLRRDSALPTLRDTKTESANTVGWKTTQSREPDKTARKTSSDATTDEINLKSNRQCTDMPLLRMISLKKTANTSCFQKSQRFLSENSDDHSTSLSRQSTASSHDSLTKNMGVGNPTVTMQEVTSVTSYDASATSGDHSGKIIGDKSVALSQDMQQQVLQLHGQLSSMQQQIMANQQLLDHSKGLPQDQLQLLHDLQRQMMLNQQLLQQQLLANPLFVATRLPVSSASQLVPPEATSSIMMNIQHTNPTIPPAQKFNEGAQLEGVLEKTQDCQSTMGMHRENYVTLEASLPPPPPAPPSFQSVRSCLRPIGTNVPSTQRRASLKEDAKADLLSEIKSHGGRTSLKKVSRIIFFY